MDGHGSAWHEYEMRSGVIMEMRAKPGAAGFVVLVALFVPLLLGLLPPLTPTAAFALERDIAASLCAPGEEQSGSPVHENHPQCCILCPAAHGHSAMPSEAADIPARRAPSYRIHSFAEANKPVQAAVAAYTARGPPSV